ncbi:hypothetical protein C8F04DRAFT_986129 [Mycena alexandri]|uniref:JmjC domain-containing protein n=1 Tax=Mycena alexandri TaxID=1745969 RepID=A0AAD6XK20_9AGAR|nr:hypothetical protein C8F04DRAFT_986129 [Mycena alexandri]
MSSPSAPMAIHRLLNESPSYPRHAESHERQQQHVQYERRNVRYETPQNMHWPQQQAYGFPSPDRRVHSLGPAANDFPTASAGPSSSANHYQVQEPTRANSYYSPNYNAPLPELSYFSQGNEYPAMTTSRVVVRSEERTTASLGAFVADPNETQPQPRSPQSSHYSHRAASEISSSSRASSLDLHSARQYQEVERASARLVAKETSSSPATDNPRTYPARMGEIDRRAATASGQLQEQRKRDVISIEDAEEPPKSKRKLSAKPREKTASGTNKRSGYTHKKRSEAAQTAALSDRIPNNMYTLVPRSKGRDRDEGRYDVVRVKLTETTKCVRDPQTSRCMSSRYKDEGFSKCIACTRRWQGDTCRFQNIRSFFRDSRGRLTGMSFTERAEDLPQVVLQYPANWNIPLDKAHIDETKKISAAALLPTLREELEHIQLEEVVYRPRENEVRATCDTCLTSIFCCSWMCRVCGREACSDCFKQIKALTIELPEGASQNEIDERSALVERQLHLNPGFLSCLKRHDHGANHFSPMTRFARSELETTIQNMERLLLEDGMAVDGVSVAGPSGSVETRSNNRSSSPASSDGAPSPSSDSETTLVPADFSSPVTSGSTLSEIPSHEIMRFKDSELTEEIFRPLWAMGQPLLITDAGKKLKIDWSPEYFMEEYGSQSCVIIECQTEINKGITVAEFFRDFGNYEGREGCWKLKDWPPASDFQTAFPELYDDFSQAVPMPNYVRRDGALNFASHFPLNTIGPDLGPKMYNAHANREEVSTKGSTRLHMDMADALNLMAYAAPGPDGQEGCAAWDLFRAEDSGAIRQFLRSEFTVTGLDPIHSQQVYLDDEKRRQLWEEHGVKSFRVYQKAGEAVFIPAGCAHQVRNLSDCIKVAIDFVSPENIERCEKLTKEFREVNHTKAWKEDVLQLRTMMWFAWLSCCQQEEKMRKRRA